MSNAAICPYVCTSVCLSVSLDSVNDRNGNELIAGAASEALAWWLHHQSNVTR